MSEKPSRLLRKEEVYMFQVSVPILNAVDPLSIAERWDSKISTLKTLYETLRSHFWE